MKIISLILLVLAALFFAVYAHAETLDDAHRAFAEDRYSESISGYEAVLAQKGYSAPVLFDLGNSYYRAGDFARAIMTYQRAQWLAPNDPDIAANLQLAQKQAGLTATVPRSSEKFSHFLSTSEWAWLGCLAWTLLCATFFARTLWPQQSLLFVLAGTATAFVLVTAITAMAISSGELRQAVVIDKNAAALISPFPAAQTVFAPTPGETVAVQETYHDFLRVQDSAGRTGWISKAQIEPIIPPRASASPSGS